MPRPRSEKSRFELPLPQLDFYVLASSSVDAALTPDRTTIKGHFGVPKSKRNWQVVSAFANWSADEPEILRFVRRFGPLTIPHGKPGAAFAVRLEEWRDFQRSFRLAWEEWSLEGPWGRWQSVTHFEPREEMMEHLDGQVKLSFTTLGRYLLFALRALPRERLKLCRRPDCPHRYFIAQHLKERYCGEECANWGDKQVKRRWWNETGASQRQEKSANSVRRRRR